MITAEQGIAAIHKRFGVHAGRRALHAKGTLCTGSFVATPEAAALTTAGHMQGTSVPVLARVSNGGGNPKIPDYEMDVRGLAVSFELPDGSRTDIVAQTAPHFALRDADSSFSLLAASKPGPAMLLRFPLFLARHPGVAKSLPANSKALRPPSSYATIPYYPIHAYRWIAPDGTSRYVRYTWEPLDPQPRLSSGEARRRGRDYLQEEIAERLAGGEAGWELFLQIAGEGDDPDDPSSQWASTDRVKAGTLTLTAITEDGDANVFDPMRLTEGIEASDDPILRFRPQAYSRSHELRSV
jgi:catalase